MSPYPHSALPVAGVLEEQIYFSKLPFYKAYAYGAGIVGMSAIYTLTHHQYWFGVMHTGMKLRVAHSSFIYRKVSLNSIIIIRKEIGF